MAERIVRMATVLLVTICLARYLGPERFGLFHYALSFVGLFSIFAVFVSDEIVVRELIDDPGEENHILGSAFFLRLCGSLFAFFLSLSIHFLVVGPDNTLCVLISILAIAQCFQALHVIRPFFHARVQAKFVAQAQLFQLCIGTLAKLYLIIIHAPLVWFAWAIFFDNFLLAVPLYFFYRQQDHAVFDWHLNRPLLKYLGLKSLPLLLSGIVTAFYMRIDQVMIGRLLDNTAVGYYAAAVRLSESWYFIPMVISVSLFPALLNTRKNDLKLYYEYLSNLYKLVSALSWISALCIMLLCDYIIILIYGASYTPAGSVLMIHIWGGFFVALGVASGKALIAENLMPLLFYRTLSGAIINVMLNIILIPSYGIVGAALATLIAQITAALLYDAFDPRTRKMFKMKWQAMIWPFPHI